MPAAVRLGKSPELTIGRECQLVCPVRRFKLDSRRLATGGDHAVLQDSLGFERLPDGTRGAFSRRRTIFFDGPYSQCPKFLVKLYCRNR